MTDDHKIPELLELHERIDAVTTGMDRRKLEYREARAIGKAAMDEVRAIRDEARKAVAEAVTEARTEAARAAGAIRAAEAAKEALELRQSGRSEPGHPVTISQPRGANGRDWTVDELEETCFRLRVAGLAGQSRLTLRSDSVSGHVPYDSQLPPSKAELAEREQAEATVRAATRTKRIKRAVLAVPASMVAIPATIAVVVVFKFVTTFLWSLL
jgi:hypothetical protein